MNIIIIEDERITASDLVSTINSVEPTARIIAVLDSVKTAVSYLESCDTPDLIFSDIQLGDGLSFDVFKTIKTSAPVIFCTAYDEYALDAFRSNGIDYILKPFTKDSVLVALEKYKNLTKSSSINYVGMMEHFEQRAEPKVSSVLVHYKDKILPVSLSDVALFFVNDENTSILTFNQQKYLINRRLDDLEKITGERFFRANRQILLNRKAVVNASHFFSRKLSVSVSVDFPIKIIVSKEKSPAFLKWLENIQ